MADKANDLRPEVMVGVPAFYSDVVEVFHNYNGFRLTFGTLQSKGLDGPRRVIEARVAVGMSPEHAKSLCRVLEGQLRLYEERFGPVRSEPEKPKKDGDQQIAPSD